jgi:hypothetical protein
MSKETDFAADLVREKNATIGNLLNTNAELLEALENLLAHPGTHHSACIHWQQVGCDCEFSEVANAARSAITRARGETA